MTEPKNRRTDAERPRRASCRASTSRRSCSRSRPPRSSTWASWPTRDRGRPAEKNLPLARQTIDTLEMLQEKTRGNLDEEETQAAPERALRAAHALREGARLTKSRARARLASQLDAPAKVNLGLRIVGRRSHGYHELESLFVPLDLADALALASRPRRAAEVALALAGDAAGAPPGDDNLAVRAARAFLARAGSPRASRSRSPSACPWRRASAAARATRARCCAASRRRFRARSRPRRSRSSRSGSAPTCRSSSIRGPRWVTGIGERLEPLRGLPRARAAAREPGRGARHARGVPRLRRARARARRAPAPPALARRASSPPTARSRRGCTTISRRPPRGSARRSRGCARAARRGARAVGMSGSGPTRLRRVRGSAPPRRPRRRRFGAAGAGLARVAATGESR